MSLFAELLTQYMRRVGVSDSRLAWKLDITRQTIFHWRTGDIKRPNCEKILRCAEVLRLTAEERAEFLRAVGCPAEADINVAGVSNPQLLEDAAAPLPVVGIPISMPHQFFGREKELKRIFKKWERIPLHSVAVVGPRRSGKTSLLHYIKNIHTAAYVRANQQQNWLNSDYQFIFIDFKTAGMCEEERLLRYLLTEMRLTVPEPCNLTEFTDVIRTELCKPTVLLMDEINVALQSPELDYRFWWGIRALIGNQTNGLLGLLVASYKSPLELTPSGGADKPSPFLNIIGHVLNLGAFTATEAHELLAHLPEPLESEIIDWILEITGGWPALLQIVCDTYLLAIEEQLATAEWQAEALERIKPYQDSLEER